MPADHTLAAGNLTSVREIAGNLVVVDLDIPSGDDVGGDLADGDLVPLYRLSAAAPKKSAVSRVWDYVKAKIAAATNLLIKIQTFSYSANQTLTADQCYNSVIYVTAAATITLPPVAVGMNFTVIAVGAVVVSVDPNAADKFYLDGTALADGDKITSPGTAGAVAAITYFSADGFHASTNAWVDGN